MKSFFTALIFSFLVSYIHAQVPLSPNLNTIVESEKRIALRLSESSETIADNYDVKYHRCEWNIDPNVYYISGSVATYFVPKTDDFSELDFDFSYNLQIDSIRYHNSSIGYAQRSDDVLAIFLPAL
ncbi:MAG: hypothetical protein H0W62_01145 [Chitinophagales bacterium]|nr:hypothetical protein [Chitinophagales bacterium]